MDLRVLGALLGEDRAAEPVHRPGVWVIGFDVGGDWAKFVTDSHTGRTNVGLNLGSMNTPSVNQNGSWKHTEKPAIVFLSKKPSWRR
jgi:hypothetical protein